MYIDYTSTECTNLLETLIVVHEPRHSKLQDVLAKADIACFIFIVVVNMFIEIFVISVIYKNIC